MPSLERAKISENENKKNANVKIYDPGTKLID